MATQTAYQVQYRQRMKQALRRRSDAERKLRAYGRLLAEALDEATAAGSVLALLNKTYATEVAPTTALGEQLGELVAPERLREALTKTTAPEVVVPVVRDSKDGLALPADEGLGEAVPRVPAKRSAVAARGPKPASAPEVPPIDPEPEDGTLPS